MLGDAESRRAAPTCGERLNSSMKRETPRSLTRGMSGDNCGTMEYLVEEV
jgi:hypothetical protein